MQEQVHQQCPDAIRVIVADDSPSFRRGVCTFLGELPQYTIVGETGQTDEVLRLCAQSPPDIMLLDSSLSGPDGQALMAIVRARYPAIKQVVFVTPDDEDGLAACVTCGVDGCISKNAAPHLILLAVQSVLAGEHWLQQEMVGTMFNRLRRTPQEAHARCQAVLSHRELEVIRLLSHGLRNKEIALHLFISEHTVKAHVTNILDKLGVRGRVEAVRYAIDHGIVHH